MLTGVVITTLVLCCLFTGGYSWDLCLIPSAILSVFMLLMIFKGKANTSTAIISILLLTLSAASVFVTLGDTQSSIYEAQKIILFVTAFYIASVADIKGVFLKSLSYLSAFVAVLGFLAYSNILNVNEFIFLDRFIPRLQSVIRYANTTAVFLGVGYISCLCAYREYNKKMYILLSAITLPAFYLTLSKAMIPIFIIVGTAYILAEKDLRDIFINQNIISMLFCAAVVYFGWRHTYFLCFVLLGILIPVSYKLAFRKIRKIFALWIVLILLAAALATAILIIKFDSLTTLTGRLLYAKDSLKLVLRNPLLGCGQGSWQYMQYQVQTRGYAVKYIHNSYLQFAAENGLIFTALMLFVFVYSFAVMLRDKGYGLCAMLLMIYIHSFVDFDVSYGIILLMLGMLCGSAFVGKKHFALNQKITKVFACIAVLACMTVCIYAACEFAVRDNFEKAYISKNYEMAEKYNNSLVVLCPRDPQVYINRAALELSREKAETDAVRENLEKAVALSPKDYTVLREYIRVLADGGSIDSLVKKYISLCPRQESCYTFLKETTKKLCDEGSLTGEKYKDILDYIEAMRIKNKVEDRNSLLRDSIGD